MKHQPEAGTIALSGPSPDHTLGMYLIRTSSRDEAERIAASDPLTAAGACAYELIDWQIDEIMGVGFRNLDALSVIRQRRRCGPRSTSTTIRTAPPSATAAAPSDTTAVRSAVT
jgi:hypothetical protein